MRQGVITAALVSVVFTFSIQGQSGIGGPDPQEDSRSSGGQPKTSTSTIERPYYSDLQVEDLFEKIRIGLTCSQPENSIKNYLFTEADVENYLNQFESIATKEAQLSRNVAQDKMDILLANVKKTLSGIGIAEDVILHDYELLYSDENKVFKVVRLEMDALLKGDDAHLEMLLVDLDGNFKILSAGQD